MSLEILCQKSAIVWPFLGNGFTRSGIYVQHHSNLPPILALIMDTSPDLRSLTPGDVVVIRPHSPEIVRTSQGIAQFLHESAILAVLDGYNATVEEVFNP